MNWNFNKRINKKANAFDVIYILIVVFIFIVVTLIAFKVYNEWSENGATKLDSPTANIATQKAGVAIQSLDVIFGFLIGMLIILVIISAFTIDTHPAFFVVTLILLIIAIILAVAFSNIYETISQEKLPTEAASFPIANYLMGNLPTIALVAIIIVAIVLYAKFQTG